MEKRLAEIPAGTKLIVLATDPIARIDIPLYCAQHGHDCVQAAQNDVLRFEIIKR